LKKAREVFLLTGLPSLGDDTGLEVGYLNGRPGVYSSRYAGPGASYADNCKKLLKELRGVPLRRRTAKFRCILAFIPSEHVREMVQGIVRGTIAEEPRGSNGFGYDPLFVPEGFRRTFAELDTAEKNVISHRGKAIEEFKKILPKYLAGS
jgi:XTP/dITP diphosphohydrolase